MMKFRKENKIDEFSNRRKYGTSEHENIRMVKASPFQNGASVSETKLISWLKFAFEITQVSDISFSNKSQVRVVFHPYYVEARTLNVLFYL